jgi:hypothetical protein
MSKNKTLQRLKRRQKEEDRKETLKYYQCIIYVLTKQLGGEVDLDINQVCYPDGDLSITCDKEGKLLSVRAQKSMDRNVPYPEPSTTKSYSSHQLRRAMSLDMGDGERMTGEPGDWIVFDDAGEEFLVSDEEHARLFPGLKRHHS